MRPANGPGRVKLVVASTVFGELVLIGARIIAGEARAEGATIVEVDPRAHVPGMVAALAIVRDR